MCLLDVLASLRAAPARLVAAGVVLGDDGPLRAGGRPSWASRATCCPLPAGAGRPGRRGADGGPAAARRGRPGAGRAGPGAPAAATASYLARLRRRLSRPRPRRRPDQRHEGARAGHAGPPPRGAGGLAPARLLRLPPRDGPTPAAGRAPAAAGVRVVAVSHSVADDAARVLGPRRAGRRRSTTPSTSTRFAPDPATAPGSTRAAGLPPAAAGHGPRRPGRHLRPLEGARRLSRGRGAGRRRPCRCGSTWSAARSTAPAARSSRPSELRARAAALGLAEPRRVRRATRPTPRRSSARSTSSSTRAPGPSRSGG